TRVHEPARIRALAVALKRGGQINRRGDRSCCGIHLVSGMHGYGFDFHLRTLNHEWTQMGTNSEDHRQWQSRCLAHGKLSDGVWHRRPTIQVKALTGNDL